MVTKKHPKRKPVSEDYTYAPGKLNIFDRARKIVPAGYTYGSVFWETTITKDEIIRRGVGVYKQRGVSDLQLYLDDKSVRTARAKTAESYGELPNIAPVNTESNYTHVPIPLKPARKYLEAVIEQRGEESLFYHLWTAIHNNDTAVLKAAKEMKLKLPPYTPYAEVIARLKREKDPAVAVRKKHKGLTPAG